MTKQLKIKLNNFPPVHGNPNREKNNFTIQNFEHKRKIYYFKTNI